ncbi:hypothetical protein LIER_16891 [Lithospermum erythrorhizon]|uniref:Uncharacterized protein n=1 Tax=Lithospermum erythrorhizon TaxID=34254 RepID=A0AAV3Q8B9_LITER
MISKLWDIYSKKDTIWVKWVNTVRLKGKSIWAYKSNIKDSWGWKCISGHRHWLYQNVEVDIGDGKDTFIWFDPWLEGKSLNDCQRDVKEKLVYRDFHTVAVVKMCSHEWRWPRGRRMNVECTGAIELGNENWSV